MRQPHSVIAKGILKRNGMLAAACYLRNKGFPFYMSHFILLGKWPN